MVVSSVICRALTQRVLSANFDFFRTVTLLRMPLYHVSALSLETVREKCLDSKPRLLSWVAEWLEPISKEGFSLFFRLEQGED